MRFLLIDDHLLFTDGLEYVLNRVSAAANITQTASAVEALKILEQETEFDLVLLDLNMPDMGGITFIETLNQRPVFTPIAILSATENISQIQQALDAGALGFISKAASSEELILAVKSLLEGETWYPDWYVSSRLRDEQNQSNDSAIKDYGITNRQLQVLKLMVEGHSNREISEFLHLSEATVKSHISALFRTLESKNRTECINIATRRGIIDTTS